MTLDNRNASFHFLRDGLAGIVMSFPYGSPALRAHVIFGPDNYTNNGRLW